MFCDKRNYDKEKYWKVRDTLIVEAVFLRFDTPYAKVLMFG